MLAPQPIFWVLLPPFVVSRFPTAHARCVPCFLTVLKEGGGEVAAARSPGKWEIGTCQKKITRYPHLKGAKCGSKQAELPPLGGAPL